MDARQGDEGGGVALLTLCGGLVLLMAGLLVLSAVTEVGIAAARARTAADAAALAAVSNAPPDGCALARVLAEANGASLDTCRMPAVGAAIVEVTVRPRSPLVRSLAGALPARAAAVREPWAVHPGSSG